MSYATLENKIRALPEECLDEVSDYIDYILFRMQMKKKTSTTQDKSDFFGILKGIPDGLDLQFRMRNEQDEIFEDLRQLDRDPSYDAGETQGKK